MNDPSVEALTHSSTGIRNKWKVFVTLKTWPRIIITKQVETHSVHQYWRELVAGTRSSVSKLATVGSASVWGGHCGHPVAVAEPVGAQWGMVLGLL